jgi:pSer/pThr/pTyr-binding forkhead associated (FHA) protein
VTRFRITLDNDTGPEGQPVTLTLALGEGERAIIGRGKTAQIICATGGCSRHHCAFLVLDGALYLEDLGSSNGTWLNGQKIKRSQVKTGDKIHAGRPRIELRAIESVD